MPVYVDEFAAMDTTVHLVLLDGEDCNEAAAAVRSLFREQEQMFSRFRATSMLSRLNSAETIRNRRFVMACKLAIEAYELTEGLFNPMILPALRAAGYRDVGEESGSTGPAPSPKEALTISPESVSLTSG